MKRQVKNKKTGLRLKVGEPMTPSPFVVRLTRRGEEPRLIAQSDPVEELAKSLIFETEEDGDEAPLVEAHEGDQMLHIALEDLRDQLLEGDKQELEEPRLGDPLAFLHAKDELDHVVPSAAFPVTSTNVLEDIFAETLPSPLVAAEPIAASSVVFVEMEDTDIEDAVALSEAFPSAGPTRVAVFSWTRALVSFVAMSVLVVLPLQAASVFASARTDAESLTGESKAALDVFLRGATSLSERRFTTATEDFSHAAEQFEEVQASLDDMHGAVVAVVNVIPQTERTMTSVRGLVTAGQELSRTAELLSMAAEDIGSQDSIDLVTKLQLLSTYIEAAKPHAVNAALALEDVDSAVIPAEYQEKVGELKERAPQVAHAFEEFTTFTDAITLVLGGEQKMRYLAAFQNNTELRPTGGFVGSLAEIDVKDGAITRMNIPGGGSYANQGQLTEFVAAPGPLQLLKARWEFQDANWFPDFPTSAKKMLWFSEHSGGPTMDGVMAVNATFVQDLLGVLGPVEMPKYGRTIDAENFLLETQKIVELEYDKTENAPKAFIGDLAPILLERVTSADLPTLLSVLDLVGKGLEEKDVMVYFRDNTLEAAMEDLDWTGSLKNTSGDYLMVVNTNLGGGKTDGVIDQQVDVEVAVDDGGSIVNTVTITKTHRGMKSALFSGVNNVDYLRLYVPEGSELIRAEGFEAPADEVFEDTDIPLGTDEDLELQMKNINVDLVSGTDTWDEAGKSVFGNWMQTAPGETEVVTVSYKLPFKLSFEGGSSLISSGAVPYSLFVQKQSGVEKRITSVKVNMPKSVQVLWTSPNAATNLTAETDNGQDSFFAWLLDQE